MLQRETGAFEREVEFPPKENPFFPVGNSRFRQGELPFPSRETVVLLRRNFRFQREKRKFPKKDFLGKLYETENELDNKKNFKGKIP